MDNMQPPTRPDPSKNVRFNLTDSQQRKANKDSILGPNRPKKVRSLHKPHDNTDHDDADMDDNSSSLIVVIAHAWNKVFTNPSRLTLKQFGIVLATFIPMLIALPIWGIHAVLKRIFGTKANNAPTATEDAPLEQSNTLYSDVPLSRKDQVNDHASIATELTLEQPGSPNTRSRPRS